MKHGKRPTRKQKIAIDAAGWNPDNWLVVKCPPGEIHLVHRKTKTEKVLSA